MRLVNAVTANRVAHVRRKSSACELTSMATTSQCASRMRANSSCRSGDSGVVCAVLARSSPTRTPTVPMTPVRLPATRAICSTRNVVVVLPLVPVTPTRAKSFEGSSWKLADTCAMALRVSGTTTSVTSVASAR